LLLYRRLYGCKLILDVAEVWERSYWTSYLGHTRGRLADWYASTFIKIADAYIANSSFTATRLRDCGIESSKIHTFAPVIDDRQMKKIKPANGKQIIFY